MLRVYVDAATRGNPGPSAGGIVIDGAGLHEQIHVPLGCCSNHEAEFKIFLKALSLLIEQSFHKQTVLIHSDSKIVTQIVEREFTKNSLFQPYLDQFNQLNPYFLFLVIKWVPERKNKGADSLAKQALQKFYPS